MKKLVDLLIEITKNSEERKYIIDLLKENPTHVDLGKRFSEKGYSISEEECKLIIKHKDDIIGKVPSPLGYS